MPVIYHITQKQDWESAVESGFYEHASLKDEGFIHCSTDRQVSGVLERYFAGKTDLVKLVINTELLTSPYIFDWSPSSNDNFPHIYGPLNTDAVIETIPL